MNWPKERGGHRIPSPAQITKTLVWLMRDRGQMSPDDLQGVRHTTLRMQSMARRSNRSVHATFDASLEAAIAEGWIEVYEDAEGELRYLPNYRRNAA